MQSKHFKYNIMKNILKTTLVALTVLTFAACGTKKTGEGVDSTTVKVDSTTKTTVDSTKKDTVKVDTTKKDTTKKM
jgi:predicted small lipoprotein YifL